MSVKSGISADNEWLSRCEDFEQSVLRYKSVRFSRFVTPHDLAIFKTHFKPSPFVSVKIFGGADDTERNMIGFFPDFLEGTNEDFPITPLLIENVSGMTHRDILGSVLGLGIKREMTGDIFVDENIAVLMCDDSIRDFLLFNLKTVGRKKVEVSVLDENTKISLTHAFVLERRVVSSLRLDAVVCSMTGFSRSEASNAIGAENVSVNFCVYKDTSKKLSEGDVVSVKHHGRYVLESVDGETKKGRLAIIIKKFV